MIRKCAVGLECGKTLKPLSTYMAQTYFGSSRHALRLQENRRTDRDKLDIRMNATLPALIADHCPIRAIDVGYFK